MIIVHRDIPGEHNTEGGDCWCEPLKIDEDEPKEIVDEKVRIHELKN
jgi:hypothetical protein